MNWLTVFPSPLTAFDYALIVALVLAAGFNIYLRRAGGPSRQDRRQLEIDLRRDAMRDPQKYEGKRKG